MEKLRESGKFEYVYRSGKRFELFTPYPLPPILPTVNLDFFEKINYEAEMVLSKLSGISSITQNIDVVNNIFLKNEIIASISLADHNSISKNVGIEYSKFENNNDFSFAKNLLDSFNKIKKIFDKTTNDFSFFDALKNINLIGQIDSAEQGALNEWESEFYSNQKTPLKNNIHTINDSKLISNFDIFLNDSNYPILVRVAIALAQFMIMSPLKLNNGIYARFLVPLLIDKLIIGNGVLVCVSTQFERNRLFFQKSLANIIDVGDWESWIFFIYKSIIEASNSTILQLTQIFHSLEVSKKKLLHISNGSLLLYKLFEYMQANQSFTIDSICSDLNVAFSTVNIAVDKLIELKMIGEITGNKRNRAFSSIVYINYLFKN